MDEGTGPGPQPTLEIRAGGIYKTRKGTVVEVLSEATDYPPGNWRCDDGWVRTAGDFLPAAVEEQQRKALDSAKCAALIEDFERFLERKNA